MQGNSVKRIILKIILLLIACGNLQAREVGTPNSGGGGGATPGFVSSPHLVTWSVSNPNNDLVTGDGQVYFRVPAEMDGWALTSIACSVSTASSSGLPTFQLRRAISTGDMLSTKVTIDADEKDSKDALAPAVIDVANATVATGEQVNIDVDTAGTGTRGAVCNGVFTEP